ncbi:MAG: polysaccharide deacetylase family protein [Deltaproteobacteria bacterium]|nr:polysaccharide deacetylase family protein [Deltaproteobacteria bacterium]
MKSPPKSKAEPVGPVAPRVVTHGDRRSRRVALTFDACSTEKPSGYDPKIVEILRETATPATLFLGGKWMLEHPEVTRELAASPLFELANHTLLHPHLTREPDARVRHELRRTQEILHDLTGRWPRYYRPPFGEVDARVAALAAELGLTTIQFDLASGDPDPAFTKKKLVDEVVGRARGGSIVVLHVNGRGRHTAEALPEIVRGLRARGFELCTVGDLLDGAGARPEKP